MNPEMTGMEKSKIGLRVTKLIVEKLARAIIHITNTRVDPDTGRLGLSDQLAVRKIQSCMRRLDREWMSRWGDPISQMRADVELQCDNDHGEIKTIGEKTHGVGRLDCRACEVTFELVPGETIPRRLPLSKKCLYCKKGIVHVYHPKEWNTGRFNEPKTSEDVQLLSEVWKTSYGPKNEQNHGSEVRVGECDVCGRREVEVTTGK